MRTYNDIQKIWIEAEEWKAGTWQAENGNTDVLVHEKNGSKWIASFFSYKNIMTLVEKNKRTGECLSGGYFWSSNMILVEEISRTHIEIVIQELINTSLFEEIFVHVIDE